MKKLILAALLIFTTAPAMAKDSNPNETLKRVEPQYICMVNNAAFDKEQIAVEVDGKTYYGCCSMCEARLKKDASLRMAVDPVTNVEVDKASAVIGEDQNGNVYYFENEENFTNYSLADASEAMNHDRHDMEGMKSMDHSMHSSGHEDGAIQGTGTIHKIMAEDNKLNMTHGAIPAIQWPEMTMDFTVADTVDLSSFKPEDNVMFSLKLENKAYVITNMHIVQNEENHGHDEHGHTTPDMEK